MPTWFLVVWAVSAIATFSFYAESPITLDFGIKSHRGSYALGFLYALTCTICSVIPLVTEAHILLGLLGIGGFMLGAASSIAFLDEATGLWISGGRNRPRQAHGKE